MEGRARDSGPRPSTTKQQQQRKNPKAVIANNRSATSSSAAVYSYTQNLVSVLNDPAKSRHHVEDLFTRDWGAAFSTDATTDFVLSRTGSKALRQAASTLTKTDLLAYLAKWRERRRLVKRITSDTSALDPHRRKSQEHSKASKSSIPTSPKTHIDHDDVLEDSSDHFSVDRIFFSEDFNLCSEETFTRVLTLFNTKPDHKETEDSDKSTESAILRISDATLRSSERILGDNLDIIEEKLAEHVRRRANDFFKVMTSLDSVMADLSRTIRSVTATREKVFLMRTVLVKPSWTSVALHFRSRNMHEVASKLHLMTTVHQTQPAVQIMLASGNYVGALELILTSREVTTQELVGISCFRHLPSQLNEIQKAIRQMMLNDFVRFLACHWNRPIPLDLSVILESEQHQQQQQHKQNNGSDSVRTSTSSSSMNYSVSVPSPLHSNVHKTVSTFMESLAASDEDALLEERSSDLVNIILGILKECQIALNFEASKSESQRSQEWTKVFFEEAKAAIKAIMKQAIILFTTHTDEELFSDSTQEDETAEEHRNHQEPQSTTSQAHRGTVRSIPESHAKVSSSTDQSDAVTRRPRSSASSSSLEIARRIKSFQCWILLIKTVILTLVILLRRIKKVHDCILQAVEAHFKCNSDEVSALSLRTSPEPLPLPPHPIQDDHAECLSLIRKSFVLIYDVAYRQVTTLLETRLDAQRLTVFQFVEFVKTVNLLNECCTLVVGDAELTGDRRNDLMRVLIVREGNKFVSRFHDERKKKVNMCLDIEQWRRVTLVATLSGTSSPRVNGAPLKSASTKDGGNRIPVDSLPPAVREVLSALDPTRAADPTQLIPTNALITLIHVITEYVACSSQILLVSTDLALKSISLIKHFNQRTTQLVLNARAVQVAGLKTISARNLMTAQSTINLLRDYVRAILRDQFSEIFERQHALSIATAASDADHKQIVSNDAETIRHEKILVAFDDLLVELEEQSITLEEKVITIVREVMEHNFGSWEAKPPVPSPPFSAIASHMTRLYANIQDVLPSGPLKALFCDRIHAVVLCDLLRAQLARLGISPDCGPQFGLVAQELSVYCRTVNAKTGLGLSWDEHFGSRLWPAK